LFFLAQNLSVTGFSGGWINGEQKKRYGSEMMGSGGEEQRGRRRRKVGSGRENRERGRGALPT